ncbi:MAG: DNA polymerase III subunit alpha [Ignavibacteria bacterium]|jgi:DNA polymerase-3 subunit alpha|nr:DNA polymerase III subunit alpha [Ignavibacteria bacterium]MDH7526747.1 DNA polymerase III subunit alpha [Ignavibacteria bacterium]
MPEFVHLHNHSDYSLQDGAARIKDLVQAAVENKMKAVALTDHGNLFGAVKFYKEAKSNGIKPIIGMEAYITIDGDRFSRPSSSDENDYNGKSKRPKHYNHLILIAKNEIGFKNLSILSSLGYLEGFYYKPRIDFELLKKYSEGLICLSACAAGILSYHLLNNDYEKAKKIAHDYKELFGDDFYIELQNHYMDIDKILLEGLPKIANELNIKMVATNDVHYIRPEHAIPHNVLLQISNSRGESDYKTLRYGTDQIFFKSADEMAKLFKGYKGAIENTLEIAEKVNFELKKQKDHLPEFKIPENDESKTLDDYLTKLTYEGLQRKLGAITPEVKERAEYELDIIKKMGYSGYFLIVMDIIQAAKKKGIFVGPGRGSAAGSLVSYALDITNINPLRYGLYFERFLNPDRVSMPDIDTDFADIGREDVINYIVEKYGRENTAQIVTFNKLSAKQILRDVGRVLSIPIPKIESITKYIPRKFGKVYSIDKAIDETPELRYLKTTNDTKEKELIEYSKVLENMTRNISVHAAGIVIAPQKITEFAPLCITPDKTIVTQFDKNDIEEIGLVKMDILGLKTLTIIQKTLEMVKANHGVEIDIDKIPLDDQLTYELFAQGKTIGVFQFDKPHTREYLKRLKPNSIEELSVMNALNRPGPMQFIDTYINRKHGKETVTYIHPKLEPILKETYGIIVYQEQVMRIAHEVVGYTLSKADLMRKAMGKKDEKILAAERNEFITKGVEQGIQREIIEQIFNEIFRFKDYGFNKSHSVAYSILAYQTAYLKAHYPTEFLTANLSVNKNKTEEISLFLNECRKMGIEILPPDVNKSFVDFSIENGKIRFGLAAIKNVGESAVEEIIKTRQEKPFEDIYDFCIRVDSKAVNKRAMEGLILAGAFDNLHPNRAYLFENLEEILKYSARKKENISQGLISLFGSADDNLKPVLKEVPQWNSLERMKQEHKVLGFFISGHPLLDYEVVVRSFSNIQFADVAGTNEETDEEMEFEKGVTAIPERVGVCVVLTEIETKMYRDNQTMARLTVYDLTGEAEFIMFDKAYNQYGHLLKEYSLLYMIGRGEIRGDSLQVVAEEVYPISEVISLFGQALSIDIYSKHTSHEKIEQIRQVLHKYEGFQPVYINLVYSDGKNELFVSDLKINLCNNMISELSKVISSENITILQKNGNKRY